MTARQEILNEYSVNEHGIIRNPGKFEQEMLYAPYFSDCSSYGEELSFMEDGCGSYVSLVEVENDDRAEFPEIDATTKYIGIVENDQGFVSCTELTEEQAERWRVEYEPENEDEDEDEDEDDSE